VRVQGSPTTTVEEVGVVDPNAGHAGAHVARHLCHARGRCCCARRLHVPPPRLRRQVPPQLLGPRDVLPWTVTRGGTVLDEHNEGSSTVR
jgi:hypothetical protein